jgi:hypothetical protein
LSRYAGLLNGAYLSSHIKHSVTSNERRETNIQKKSLVYKNERTEKLAVAPENAIHPGPMQLLF